MTTSDSSVNMPTGSYARIHNPRVLLVIRVVLFAAFTFITIVGVLSLPANFRFNREEIVNQPDMIRDLANLGIAVDVGTAYDFLLTFVPALVFTAAGFVIFFYRSDDWTAILLSCFLVGNGIGALFYAHTGFGVLGLMLVIEPIIAWFPIFPMLCMFPDGRFVPRWSVWLVPIYFISCLPIMVVNYIFWEQGISIDDTLRLGVVSLMSLFWCLGAGILLLRLRRTNVASQRQQIKQLFTGALFAIIGNVAFPLIVLVPVIGTGALMNVVIVPLASTVGTLFFAVSLTFAILRYRLWDIDLVLNRGIVYIGVFVVLLLIFAGGVLVLETGLQSVLGSQQTTLAAMVSTGAVAVLFNPTRLRLQPLVDRWMFGLRFDLNMVRADQRFRPSKTITDMNARNFELYRIKELIGRGGMGEVYLGVQPTSKRQVAIKMLLPHLSTNPEFRARFERKSRTAASLHHPNIITILDYGEMSGMYYMVMEYIKGPDLAGFLRGRTLSLTETQPIITQVAAALDYAHKQGVVHRDIKPSNIMLQSHPEQPFPILMDFGLTKLSDGNTGLTQSGPLGTLAYMAPEQISAAREADHRADIYALGVMCYQIFTGKLPFSSNNQAALLFAHLHKPAPDPRLIQPDLAEQAATAILRALDKEPTNRPQSAGEFAAELFAAS